MMKKVGRNDACPCGSGKKYKQCCMLQENVESKTMGRAPISISNYLEDAIAHHQTGRLPQAEALYQQILKIEPNNPDALHLLGVLANQVGQNEIAVQLIGKSLTFKPNFAEGYNNLGNAFMDLGQWDKAIICYRQALDLKFDFAEAHNNLGTAYKAQGKSDDAITAYRQSLTLKPDHAEAHNNLGNLLQEQGKRDEAIACYRRAIEYRPNYLDACIGLGNALKDKGELEAAVVYYQQAIQLKPDIAEVYVNLGNTFKEQGKLNEAITCLMQSLAIKETPQAKIDFAACIKNVVFTQDDPTLRALVIRALSDPWARAADLSNVSISLIKLNADIKACAEHAMNAWPDPLSAHTLLSDASISSIAGDRLLQNLLENVPVCDIELERLLTTVRLGMLNAAKEAHASGKSNTEYLTLYCALARQCFINEYVFTYTSEEIDSAQRLREHLINALMSDSTISPLWLVSVASYFPLSSLPSAEKLLDQTWTEPVNLLLTQQVREPAQERQYCSTITQLTAIEDDVSKQVRQQYEENPYPRWVKAPLCRNRLSFHDYLRWKFPLLPMDLPEQQDNDEVDILIAGCGTGWQSIQTARQLQDSRILAIDLSLASLSYAKRKSHELRLDNIEYACADIMNLASCGRTFDFIESIGVLHHLADPAAGLRELLSLLRPHGFMHLGFYSEMARRPITAARAFIAENKYLATAADVRRCRQHLIAMKDNEQIKPLLLFNDFYATSECRDLLFHVQEHCFTLPQLKSMLEELDLQFMGFTLEHAILKKYEERFPDDISKTNLDYWNLFENENPDVFSGMYQFFVRKGK